MKKVIKRIATGVLSAVILTGSLFTSYVSAFATEQQADSSSGKLDSNDIRRIYIEMMKSKTTSDLSKEGVNSLSEDDLRPLALFLSNYYIPMNSMLSDETPVDSSSDSKSDSKDTDSESQNKSADTDTKGYKGAMKSACKTIGMADDTANTVVNAVVKQNIATSKKLYVSKSDIEAVEKLVAHEEGKADNVRHTATLAYNQKGIFKKIVNAQTWDGSDCPVSYYMFWVLIQMYPYIHTNKVYEENKVPGSTYIHQLQNTHKAIKLYWKDDKGKRHNAVYINQEFVEQFVAYYRNLNSGEGEDIAFSIYPSNFFGGKDNPTGNDEKTYVKSIFTKAQLYVDWVGDIIQKRGGKDNVIVMPACGNPSALTTLNHNKDNINMLNLYNLYNLGTGAWFVTSNFRHIKSGKKEYLLGRHTVATSTLDDGNLTKSKVSSANGRKGVFGNAFDYDLHKQVMRLAYNCADKAENYAFDTKMIGWDDAHNKIKEACDDYKSYLGYDLKDDILTANGTGDHWGIDADNQAKIPFPHMTFAPKWAKWVISCASLCSSLNANVTDILTKVPVAGAASGKILYSVNNKWFSAGRNFGMKEDYWSKDITQDLVDSQIKYTDACDGRWSADDSYSSFITQVRKDKDGNDAKYDYSTALQYVVMWDGGIGNWANGDDFFFQGSLLDPDGSDSLGRLNETTYKTANGADGKGHDIVSAYTQLNVKDLKYKIDDALDNDTSDSGYATITGSDDLLKHLFVTYVFAYWNGKTFGVNDKTSWGNGSAYRSADATNKEQNPVVDLCFDNWAFPAANGELDLSADSVNTIPNQVMSMAFWFLHPSKGLNYVATWFKNKVGAIFLRWHEDMVGATDSNYTTGIVKYLGVSSFTSTPNLHDMSWMNTLLNNYNTFVVYLLLIVVVLIIAQIICGQMSIMRALLGFAGFVVLIFLPPLAINGVADASNLFSDRIYSKKFDYWAVTQLESYMDKTTNSDDYRSKGDADSVDMQQVDNSTSIAGENMDRYAGVKVKWMSPKKFQYGIIAQKALGKTTVNNASTFTQTLVENTINSTISMESYVDDGGSALYIYRDYADIYKYASVSANLLTNYNLSGKINASTGSDDEKNAATAHFSIGQGVDNSNSVLNNWSAKYNLSCFNDMEQTSGAYRDLNTGDTYGNNDINALNYLGLVNRIQRTPTTVGEQKAVATYNEELGGDSSDKVVSGLLNNPSGAVNSFQEAVLANHQGDLPTAPNIGNSKTTVYGSSSTDGLQGRINTPGTWQSETSSLNAVRLGFITDNNGIYDKLKDSTTETVDYYGVHTSATSLPLNFVATYGKILEKEQQLQNTIDAGSGDSSDWALDISDFTSSNSKSFFGLPNTSFFMTVNDIVAINSDGVNPSDRNKDAVVQNSKGYKPTDFYKINQDNVDNDDAYDNLLAQGDSTVKNYQSLYGDLSDYYYALYSESPFYFMSANLQDQLSGNFGKMLGSNYQYTSDPSITKSSKLDSTGNMMKLLTNKHQAYFYNTVLASTTPSSTEATTGGTDSDTSDSSDSDDSDSGNTAAVEDTTSGDENVNINGYGEMRDFMNMHDLFYYIIPLLKQGNDMVELWGNNYGLNVYTDDSLEVHNDGSFTYDGKKYGEVPDGQQRPTDALKEFAPVYQKLSKERQYKFWHDYNTYYILTNCYTPWVDAMYDCKYAREETIKVAGEDFVVEDPLNPYTYFVSDKDGNIIKGRPMIFSKSEMEYYGLKEYNLTTVEKKILDIEQNVYDETIRLTNYAGFSDENLVNAFAMLELFEFNKEFSQTSATSNYSQYPQGWELKAFSYDAYMRLVLAQASGEPLTYTDTSYDSLNGVGKSIYARIQGNTSIFFSILLVINDILAIYLIPLLKLFMLAILFICSVLMLMGAAIGIETEFHNLLWRCLIKPLIAFLACNLGMAWVFSIFMSEGLSKVTDTGETLISLQDPTMTLLALTIIDVIVAVLFFCICRNSLKSSWAFIKNIALETAGAIAGAVERVTRAVTGWVSSRREKHNRIRTAITGTMSARGKRTVSKSGRLSQAIKNTSSYRNITRGIQPKPSANAGGAGSGAAAGAQGKQAKAAPDAKTVTKKNEGKPSVINRIKLHNAKKIDKKVAVKQQSAKNSTVKNVSVSAKKQMNNQRGITNNNTSKTKQMSNVVKAVTMKKLANHVTTGTYNTDNRSYHNTRNTARNIHTKNKTVNSNSTSTRVQNFKNSRNQKTVINNSHKVAKPKYVATGRASKKK